MQSEPPIIVLNIAPEATISVERLNFTFFHELTHHLVFEDTPLYVYLEDVVQVDAQIEYEKELLCNVGAAEFLLPRSDFAEKCRHSTPSLNTIAALANEFNSSLTATAVQYAKTTSEPVAILYFEGRHASWVAQSGAMQRLDLALSKGLEMPMRAAAARANREHRQGVRQIQARVWFGESRATIEEHSWFLSNQEAVLTLLWLNQPL